MRLFGKARNRGAEQKAAEKAVLNANARAAISRALNHASNRPDQAADRLGGGLTDILRAIETAIVSIDLLRDLVDEAEGLLSVAEDASDEKTRGLIIDRYKEIIEQMINSIEECNRQEVSLLRGNTDPLHVALDLDGRQHVAVRTVDITEHTALGDLPDADQLMASPKQIREALEVASAARADLAEAAQTLSADAVLLADRLGRIRSKDYGTTKSR